MHFFTSAENSFVWANWKHSPRERPQTPWHIATTNHVECLTGGQYTLVLLLNFTKEILKCLNQLCVCHRVLQYREGEIWTPF